MNPAALAPCLFLRLAALAPDTAPLPDGRTAVEPSTAAVPPAPPAPPSVAPSPTPERPWIGIGRVTMVDGSHDDAPSAAGLLATSLRYAGASHALVLHPADAATFVEGRMRVDAHDVRPRRTGRGAIRSGIGFLVGGTLAGLGAALAVRYAAEGSDHSLSKLIAAATIGPTAGLGALLITSGAMLRREHRRSRRIEWEVTADLRVRVGVAKPQRVAVHTRGEAGCANDGDCEAALFRARGDAARQTGAAVVSRVQDAQRRAAAGGAK